MALSKRHRARGFSIIEVLIAGVIMTLGLTGIMMMLTQTAANSRAGSTTVSGSMLANQTIQEYTALGFEGLVPIPAGSDGGLYKDYDGRTFNRTVQVTSILTDAGWPGFRVDVSVQWRDSMGLTRRNFATTVVTRAPDGG